MTKDFDSYDAADIMLAVMSEICGERLAYRKDAVKGEPRKTPYEFLETVVLTDNKIHLAYRYDGCVGSIGILDHWIDLCEANEADKDNPKRVKRLPKQIEKVKNDKIIFDYIVQITNRDTHTKAKYYRILFTPAFVQNGLKI